MLFSSYKKWWQFGLNIVACFVIAITLLFVGLLISYAFFLPMSGNPDLTFFQYVDTFFSPNWGIATSYMAGTPITEIIGSSRLYRTIELLWVPILLGLIGGIALGRNSYKLRGKWGNKAAQLAIAIGVAFPLFFLGMMLQYNSFIGGESHSSLMLLFGRFPVIGFKNPAFLDPTEITGFPILDARLSGEMYLAIDRIEHLILPIFTLTPAIIAFVAWQTRSNMERKQNEKSILSHTMKTLMIFSFIFTFYFMIDITFNLHMMGEIFIIGILFSDPNLFRGVIFVILIFLVILTFTSSLVYSIVSFLKYDRQHDKEKAIPILQNGKLNSGENNPGTTSRGGLKEYLKNIKNFYKYPLVLLGLIVTIGIIVCAIFAEPISGYTLAEANGILPGSWEPPSDPHVLGTTKFGRDVFARALYGLRGVITFGFGAVFIGLAGGLIFGFISSLHRYVNRAIEVLLIITCIIPVIFIIALFINNFGINHILVVPAVFGAPIDIVTLVIGIFLIPIFTRGIANVPLEKRNISTSLKNIVIYIPLAFGIFVLIYESLAFLGLSSPSIITLGNDLNLARLHLYDAPWASIWPGLFIFFIAFGSIILHYGLKNALIEKLGSTIIVENYREIENQTN